MSDLFCPVSVLVVRHADAEYDGSALPGVGDGGRISERGRAQVADLTSRLSGRRVGIVYSSPMSRAWQTAELVAGALDVPLRPLPGVREFDAPQDDGSSTEARLRLVDALFARWLDGDDAAAVPGGESGAAVVARFAGALDEVADQHRGETVVVVSHGGAMTLALPRMTGRSAKELSRAARLGNTAVVEVEGDADGWRMVAWSGLTDLDRPGRDGSVQGA